MAKMGELEVLLAGTLERELTSSSGEGDACPHYQIALLCSLFPFGLPLGDIVHALL